MQDFSNQTKRVLELIDIVANELNIKVPGTECLLIALSRIEASVCKFILNDYGITSKDITYLVKDLYILRKDTTNRYTKLLLEVIKDAKEFSITKESKYVNDEHLFYSLLSTKNSTAYQVLKRLEFPFADAIIDLCNMFSFYEDEEDNEDNYLVNLSKEAKLGKLKPFIGRTSYIDRVIRIISKKQKNNPMLIGSAGVGKSALVEGVALKLLNTKPNINIYRLDIGTVIAGTKYRGDLEERLLEVIEKVKNPNSILFIDEIHNIVGSGSSEGTLDIANILKPILSRGEIKVIGATTLDEYYRHLEKDKALVRRFQNIFIDEATLDETYQILSGIKHTFEDFYKVKYSKQILRYIVEMSELISNRKFPDKAIDIIDEVGLVTKNDGREEVNKKDVLKILYEYLGINYDQLHKCLKNIKYFPELEKYYQMYLMNLGIRNNILNVKVEDDETKEQFIYDLKEVFNIKDEMILLIDLNDFQDSFYSSSLIGSPKGYVGYDEGGLLTEHVHKFPLSVIIVKNYQNASKQVQRIINSAIKNGKINDAKGREVSFRNTFFIFYDITNTKSIGFFENIKKEDINFIDEELKSTKTYSLYNDKLSNILKKLHDNNYNFENEIENLNEEKYNIVLKKLINFQDYKVNKKYRIRNVNNEIKIE